VYFLDSHLDIFPENWGQSAMRTECNFTRKFLPWKSGTKASGIPVCWLIITGHLEEMFHMQNIAESHPLLFLGYIYIYIYRVSREECARLREGVPYVKVYRYNPKHLCPKLNGYGGNGQRSLKL